MNVWDSTILGIKYKEKHNQRGRKYTLFNKTAGIKPAGKQCFQHLQRCTGFAVVTQSFTHALLYTWTPEYMIVVLYFSQEEFIQRSSKINGAAITRIWDV